MAEAQQDPVSGNPVGERLRAVREEKGISLDEVARQTRIPVRHLEHIERGEWEAMPAITYAVGFARSYANAIGLDGPAIGVELREQLGGTRSASPGPAAYYEPTDPARVPPRSIAIVAIILAVLIVAGYLVWRSHAVGASSDATEIVDSASAPPAAAPAPKPRSGPQAAAAAPAANAPVVLTASEDVWIRVYEPGAAKALFQGTLKAGQQYPVPPTAQAPQIRTGRANVLRVTVAGQPAPPLGPPERTIADVSLKPADVMARPAAPGATQAGAPTAQPAAAVPPAR